MVRILANGEIVQDDDPRVQTNTYHYRRESERHYQVRGTDSLYQ